MSRIKKLNKRIKAYSNAMQSLITSKADKIKIENKEKGIKELADMLETLNKLKEKILARKHQNRVIEISKNNGQVSTPGYISKSKSYSIGKGFNHCTHNPTYAFSIDGIEFYGATKHKIHYVAEGFDLICNVSGFGLDLKNLIRGARPWLELNKFNRYNIEEMVIEWPDGEAISVEPQFFRRFVEICKEQKKSSVIVTCLGGHGRTGTMLASLLLTHDKVTAAEAIALVRSAICKECIESRSQVYFLEQLAKEVKELPSIEFKVEVSKTLAEIDPKDINTEPSEGLFSSFTSNNGTKESDSIAYKGTDLDTDNAQEVNQYLVHNLIGKELD
jgi:hypothetical protein